MPEIEAKFVNADLGLEALVFRAGTSYAVALRDTDADEVLPTIPTYDTLDEAITVAKNAAGIEEGQ